MRTLRLGSLGLLAALAVACGETLGDVCDLNQACEPIPDGGTSDGSNNDGGNVDAAADAPPGCDLAKEPKDAPACVTDAVGVFVDPNVTGATHAGTKADPLGSLAAALESAKTKGLARVYVCAGKLVEDLSIDAAHDGIALYGGFACGTWSYSGASADRAVIGKSAAAARIDSLAKGTTLADLRIVAAAGSADGESSTALFVNASSHVALVRVALEAGAGKSGAAGMAANYSFPPQGNGASASGATPGAATTVNCPNGTSSTGGKGGASGFAGDPGLPGNANGGSLGACSNSNAGGGNGAAGAAGGDGATSANPATLAPSGWTVAAGGAGSDGAPGQGGGGGAGLSGSGGGGGGAGGCGGKGGGGGGSGGASLGLVSLNATVTLSGAAITTASGGTGGAGAAGQAGQSGGFKGNGAGLSCQGGNGGKGGDGGGGAGGPGGASIGVLYKGTAPTLDAATQAAITVGTAGAGGAKGGSGSAGPSGTAAATLAAP